MNKKQIVKTLEEIALLLEIKGENSFKVSAYRRAAQALETDDRSMSEIDDVGKIKGIGKGTAQVINELIQAGESSLLDALRQETPPELPKLIKLPGLGGKKIAKLYQLLGVVDLESLKRACIDGRVQGLEGFGEKTEAKILKTVEEMNVRPERLPIAYMLPLVEALEKILSGIDNIQRFSRAGSLRRMKPMLKDLDFVIATESPLTVSETLKDVIDVKDVVASGETKMTVTLNDEFGVSVDFRFVEPSAFATALHHFTGSKEHNVLMRQIAKERGERISEYGVYHQETDEIVTFNDENAFFSHFQLNHIPPEVRAGVGEIDYATNKSFNLVASTDIRADLHMHTTWSDGAFNLEEMADAARKKGYEYIVITDHSKSLRIANGLSETRLLKQKEAIERLNQQYSDFHIFSGVEMDILPDGSLDYSDDVLRELDFVIGAIHTSFSQSQSKIMTRLRTAMENPYVRLIAHPTGRIIGGRAGYDVALDQLIEWAAETATALELNANPNRLDLDAKWLKKAQDKGVMLAVNTDAHSLDMMDHMDVGISFARRGWLKPSSILNTMNRQDFECFLKGSVNPFVESKE